MGQRPRVVCGLTATHVGWYTPEGQPLPYPDVANIIIIFEKSFVRSPLGHVGAGEVHNEQKALSASWRPPSGRYYFA
jgi:hypothetical protein